MSLRVLVLSAKYAPIDHSDEKKRDKVFGNPCDAWPAAVFSLQKPPNTVVDSDKDSLGEPSNKD